ncbi:MAG: HAMP domain-containing protein [Burkholderiales bacterium]|nr:HAMP domain-containing protein [Burkholderiales bacterium]
MILLPRSLLWRTVLLMALVIIASQLIWLALARQAEREPRAKQIAHQAAGLVTFTRTSLLAVPPDKRRFLLSELYEREGIRVYPVAPDDIRAPLPERPLARLLAREIRRELGPQTRVALGLRGIPGLWVSFDIDGHEYWVVVPRLSTIEHSLPLRWIGWGVLSMGMALVAAWFIVWRVSQPLRALAAAAEQLGKGEQPPDLPETGPQEIRALTRRFNQMNRDLARLNRERTVMLAGVSHDLRTPLARLRLAVEMLRDQVDASLHRGMIEDIADLDAIIGQFLAFARGAEQEAPRSTDLNQLVSELAERYRRSGKHLTTVLEPLPRLRLRPLAMQRAIGNLLDNAFKYGGDEVSVQTKHAGGFAFLSVLDRGPGLGPAEAAMAIQPFARLDTARGETSGAGLGLAIVDRIAQLHGGRLELLPRGGGGLEARITLPLRA